MKLVRLKITEANGQVRDFVLCDRAGRPFDIVLVTGVPGAGKTRFLQAVAAAKESVGSYGGAHPSELMGVWNRPLKVESSWVFSDEERRQSSLPEERCTVTWDVAAGELPRVDRALRAHFARFAFESHAKVELIPARRHPAVGSLAMLPPPPQEPLEARRRLWPDPSKYDPVWRVLSDRVLSGAAETVGVLERRGVALRTDVPDPLFAYKAAIARVCPDVRLRSVEPRGRTRPLVSFLARSGAGLELAELSDSELQGVLLACAFVWLGLDDSLVLLDTPELHQHPSAQLRFFEGVRGLGRNNQLIAATTSAAILASVAPEQIIDLSAQKVGTP